jgi:hypothetical protein
MALNHSPRIVMDGLVLCLDAANPKSYPGTGNNWLDLSSSSVAEGVNSPVFQSSSFAFNGTTNNRLFRIPNNTSLDTQNPSIEVWVKPNLLSQNGFWFEKGTVNSQYSLFQEGVNICFRTKPSGTFDSLYGASSVLSTANWNHIVAVKSATEKIIYINGIRLYSKSYTDTVTTTTGGMSIGAYGGFAGARGYYYDGNIANVKIYNRDLSADEVLQNFNATRSRYGV